MKVGTKSLIFGIHQVFIHPVVVSKAWNSLYGKPTFKELICIIVHDWGYFGKPDLDGEIGITHPELGAKIVGFLFGKEYYDLCACHSRSYAKVIGKEPSKLCWADKLSFAYESKKFYIVRARLSGELKELRITSLSTVGCDIGKSDEEWFDMIKSLLNGIVKDNYLKVERGN